MAKAYFINSTPTNVKIVLNGGDQQKLAPVSVLSGGTAVSSPAWGALISSFVNPNVFSGGDGNENELLYSSEQSGKTRRYAISSTVSNVLDLYFFMFEDSIVGEDQTGSSDNIIIKLSKTTQGEL
jgi:hypothetical protein